MERFDWIAEERRGLADLLDTLDGSQLGTPSLCEGWSVQDVFGHLTVPLTVSVAQFGSAMAKAFGSFDRANDRLARKAAMAGPGRMSQILRDQAEHRFVPPGGTWVNPLTDVLVHGQDIRRPLGIERTFDEEPLRVVLDFLVSTAGTRGFVPKGATHGLQLRAKDLDWSSGSGAVVEGPAEALMLVLTGRTVALADLGGDGVPVLAGRLR